jgi:hypothetical protein
LQTLSEGNEKPISVAIRLLSTGSWWRAFDQLIHYGRQRRRNSGAGFGPRQTPRHPTYINLFIDILDNEAYSFVHFGEAACGLAVAAQPEAGGSVLRQTFFISDEGRSSMPAIPEGYERLQGSERRPRRGARRISEVKAKEPLSVRICVRKRTDTPPLPDHQFWQKLPPGHRKFLSPKEAGERYGAAQSDVDLVTAFVRQHGLTVKEVRLATRAIIVSGTVQQFNKAFGVSLYHYKSERELHRGYEGHISVPKHLAGIVTGVFGLDNRRLARRLGGGSGASTMTPAQVAQLYQFPAATPAISQQAIALLEFWQPDSSGNLIACGFQQNDVNAFFASQGGGLTAPNPTPVPVGSVASNLPGGTSAESGNVTDLLATVSADTEVTMDIDIAATVAQQAPILVFFSTADENGWLAALDAILAQTNPAVTVVSISWGWPENTAEPSGVADWTPTLMSEMSFLFQLMATQRITVFAGAGDSGSDAGVNDGNAHVDYPASDPFVTACGGTVITNVNGTDFDEGTWNDSSSPSGNSSPNAQVTGGGISDVNLLPSWQKGIVNQPSKNSGLVGRGIPDIAGNASFYSGYSIPVGGTAEAGGGTSAVAPLYAGLIAVINSSLPQNIGFLNPILYALGGTDVFRDINDGMSNENFADSSAPSYTSGPLWDPCTGWGSINGSALLSALQTLYKPALTIVLDRSTYGQNEVAAKIATDGGVFDAAIFVIVDGLTPSDFASPGIITTSPNPSSLVAKWAPSFQPLTGELADGTTGSLNIQITPTGVSSSDPSLGPEVQRFTFTYQVVFPDLSPFAYPGSAAETLTITATLTPTGGPSSGVPLTQSAQIELIKAEDPYFSNESNGAKPYLSEDLRVFSDVQGATRFGAPPLANTSNGPLEYVNWIIQNLSGPEGTGPNGDTFESLPSELTTLELFPTTLSGENVFNFAIARVRLDGATTAEPAKKVRVFFRLFQSQVLSNPYPGSYTGPAGVSAATGVFREYSDGTTDGVKVPLLGISADGTEYITVPFFATQRVAATQSMTTQPEDLPNAQQIPPAGVAPPSGTVYAYFGCWLDVNVAAPQFPSQPPSGSSPDGPFTGQTLIPITQMMLRGGHQCLIAEISDDEAPIPYGAFPSTSDKLAQRNLALSLVPNPGLVHSRLATHTFDVRPSQTGLTPDYRPDELMIDWGTTPAGSTAFLYLPAVAAADILSLAARMYPLNTLTASDTHTIQCPVGGTTYIPIPEGSGANFAGLLSVQLPFGVRKGQEFTIVARQITSLLKGRRSSTDSPWRRIVSGAFQFTIPVSTKSELLVPEERTLSLMRWIQEVIPATNRWYPVFQRYLGQLAGRVNGLGGNASTVPPTQTGIWPGLGGLGVGWGTQPPGGSRGPGRHGDRSLTGKIEGIIFDHFGDFEGFILETADGEHYRFRSRERAVLRLLQGACADRITTTVVADHDRPEWPKEIIVRGASHCCEC